MNNLELSIIIQKEMDKCNEKIKKYDKKYKPEKKEKIELLYNYLNEQLKLCEDEESEFDLNKKLLLDDIQTLSLCIDSY